MKLEFSQKIFKKYWNIKFHECLSGGSRVVRCIQTDRYEGDSCFSHVCKHVQKGKGKGHPTTCHKGTDRE